MKERVLRIRRLHTNEYFSSPTMAPAVTRACRESCKYCSYRKAFTMKESPRYIWTYFKNDMIQMDSTLMSQLAEGDSLEKKEIRHFRLELMSGTVWNLSEHFYHYHSSVIRNFPKLERCDILVYDGLRDWAGFIKQRSWGACPNSKVRFIDAKTGE